VKGTSFVFVGIFCLFMQPLCVLSQTPAPTPTPEMNEAELIHFGDLIDVDFGRANEYDWRGTLNTDGNLDGLNEFSAIRALCRPEADVASEIASVYSKILRDPNITVRIMDRSNRAVAQLDGAVKIPMRFRIRRQVRLRELIVAAGGLTDDASGEIVVFRPHNLNCVAQRAVPTASGTLDNGSTIINISISELLSGKDSADPLILSGDLVSAVKAVPIYVIGAVNNPRPFYSRSGLTLSRAIATAGGPVKGAIIENVTIFRRKGTETSIIHADLEKIKNGEVGDIDLKAFDIIEVAYKGRAQRKYPPVIASGDKKGRSGQDLPLRIID
jgi:protein involved in polysaccharide export with SLBB domain